MKNYEAPEITKEIILTTDIIATSDEILKIPNADVTGGRTTWKWNIGNIKYSLGTAVFNTSN